MPATNSPTPEPGRPDHDRPRATAPDPADARHPADSPPLPGQRYEHWDELVTRALLGTDRRPHRDREDQQGHRQPPEHLLERRQGALRRH
ncbi:hypothetical protein ACWD3D_36585, partial [Streptomyces sp. NPDC002690]